MNSHIKGRLDGPKYTFEAEKCGQGKDRVYPLEVVLSKFKKLSFRVRQIWV